MRWDGGLDSARNSSAAVAAAVVTNYPHRHLRHVHIIVRKPAYVQPSICRSEGRVPNGIFDPWVRWDRGLDSVRNSSAAAVAVAAVTKKYVI